MAKAREIEGLAATTPFAQAAAATVAVRAQEVFDHAAGVLDLQDIERVHDMRVATRRLRAVLEIYAPCFPRKAHKRVLRDVKALADALGARRDPDVQLEALRAFAGTAGEADQEGLDLLAARMREDQARGNAQLEAALGRMQESGLRGRLEELVAAVVPA
jgi:CHAD domain-containing protein